MISDTIRDQITKAMKDRDEVRVSTLKLLSAALTNAEIDKKREKLTEEEELDIVRYEAKKRKDAIEAYEKARYKEKVKREKEELEILQDYLPKELSDEKLEIIVTDSIEQSSAETMQDFGKVMGLAMGKTKGRADGNRVSAIVKKKLSSQKASK